jgi:hypothetical protein
VGDKDARSVLQCEDPLHRGHIILEGRLRLLDDADVEAIRDKNVVDAFPARTVRPGPVNQNNILNAMIFVRVRVSNAPVVPLGFVVDLSDERSGISAEAAESGRGGETGCRV